MRWILALGLMLLTSPAFAASFDCAKASTEMEKAICGNPELSALDEEIAEVYRQLSRDSRYHSLMKDDQRHWLRNERTADADSFQARADFLHQFVAIADCLDSSDTPHACMVNANDALDYCMSDGNYTTFAMDRCSSLQADTWDLLLDLESTTKRDALADDPETQTLFDEAGVAFQQYREAECGWRFSEYRDGTIRGQIYMGCYLDLTSRRVLALIGDNMTY